MYFSTYFFCLYVRLKIVLSTIRSIINIHLLSKVVIMTFDYDFCCVSVQKLKYCKFFRYVYYYSVKTPSTGYRDYSVVVCLSIATFKDTKLPLSKIIKRQNTEKYQGSANRGELDINTDVN